MGWKMRLNYILYHFDLAMMFIFVSGALGVIAGSHSPHPAPMVICGTVWLGARITYAIVRKLVTLYFKERRNYGKDT